METRKIYDNGTKEASTYITMCDLVTRFKPKIWQTLFQMRKYVREEKAFVYRFSKNTWFEIDHYVQTLLFIFSFSKED